MVNYFLEIVIFFLNCIKENTCSEWCNSFINKKYKTLQINVLITSDYMISWKGKNSFPASVLVNLLFKQKSNIDRWYPINYGKTW